jgi:hypothetical protein
MVWRRCILMVLLAGLAGCAGAVRLPSDSAETVLAAKAEPTRSALIKVLEENGYAVRTGKEGGLLRTSYRREMSGPWNGLLVSRFGTVRTWVEATVAEEGDTTRVKIEVFCDGKEGLFRLWRRYETPLPEQAATRVWQLQKALDLLPGDL